MPDAARLVAAICIGTLGVVVSFLIMPLMPESTDFGYFVYINGAIGLCVGWKVMGKRAGHGVAAAISNGFGGAFLLVLWGLFVHACIQMFDRAMANWYDGPFDAATAVVSFMAEYGLVMISPIVLGVLAFGAVISGLATEFARARWR